MARVQIYLPDELYGRLKRSDIVVSRTCRLALEAALDGREERLDPSLELERWLAQGQVLLAKIKVNQSPKTRKKGARP